MPGFVKRHPEAAIATEALRRSAVLAAAGVPTPTARPGDAPQDVIFKRIDGETGLALLAHGLRAPLQVLSCLHRTHVPGLAPYDPFLRIRPRLHLTTDVPVPLDEPVPEGSATLHGDLHIGQFIRNAAGNFWLVDLDDLALGPPEADLANFAAHLATSFETAEIDHWTNKVQTAWRALGHHLNPPVFNRYLRLALVRRHLKLREKGRPDFECDVADYLRESSNFSIR